jgi:hypothetical protein
MTQNIIKMASGYRQMLCDRMPQTLDIALRWCKAKNKWVDYVYDHFIQKYPQNERSRAVKQVLGLTNYYNIDEIIMFFRIRGMKQSNNIPKEELKLSFKDTMNWEELAGRDVNELNNWKAINSWVVWFKCWYSYIESTVKISIKNGKVYSEICKEIEYKYLIKIEDTSNREKLSAFLVDNIKKYEKN